MSDRPATRAAWRGAAIAFARALAPALAPFLAPVLAPVLALALATVVAVETWRFPIAAPLLALALLAYASLLAWRRDLWLLVLPALLPVLDVTPWSGRQFFDEFDLFVLTTLAVSSWHARSPVAVTTTAGSGFGIARPVLVALSFSYLAATLIAWWQPALPDTGTSCHLYSFCGTLRSVKGFVWALALLAPLRTALRHASSGFILLAAGILLGLLGECVSIAAERVLFTGLWNFDAPFRVTGTFSSLHTGGQHLDAYLAATIPFVALLLAGTRRSRRVDLVLALVGCALFALALYATLATVSRGLLVTVLFSTAVLALGALRVFARSRGATRRVLLTGAAIAVITGWSLGPAMDGTFMPYRFAIVSKDIGLRTAHWRNALSLMDAAAHSRLLGMGLASYPGSYMRAGDEPHRPGRYQHVTGDGDPYIRLTGGNPVYFEQRVDIDPNTRYTLQIDLRAANVNTGLIAVLCEKSLRYSLRCSGTELRTAASNGHWSRVEGVIDTGAVGGGNGRTLGTLSRRPVTLAFFVPRVGRQVELDDVALRGPRGKNLIRNGGFDAQTDFWFFTADDADPWHIANLWLHLYFEQGALGVTAFTLLLAIAMWRALRGVLAGSGQALVLLASLGGFLLIGTLGSLLDSPRLSLLVYWLMFAALLLPRREGAGANDRYSFRSRA